MRAVAAIAGLVLLFRLALPEAAAADERVFVEVETPRIRYVVHEPVRIVLRFGVDARFFKEGVIQPFRRKLDVPLRVEAPWLAELAGTVPLDAGGADGNGGTLSFVLNDGPGRAARAEDRTIGGRLFTVLEVTRVFLPTRAGALVLTAPTLRYSFATRFESDLFSGRVALDGREASVTGEELVLDIDPLPDAGRPARFGGGVGRFTVTAAARPGRVEAGGIVQLVLRIAGEGNIGFFDPPPLDDLPRFHLYGRITERDEAGLTVVYDLVPLDEEVTAVPPIPFSFYDPGPPARYRTVRTAALPLDVTPPSDGERLDLLLRGVDGGGVPGGNDIFDVMSGAELSGGRADPVLPPALIAGALVPPWLLALGLLLWQLRRERDRRDPDRLRARRAAGRFRRESAKLWNGRGDERAGTQGGDRAGDRAGDRSAARAGAFARYLAARFRCPDAAVIDPGLAGRLVAAGIGKETAAEAAQTLDDLAAAGYGGADAAPDRGRVERLVARLEERFRALEEGE